MALTAGFWSKKSHEKAEKLAALKSFVSLIYAAGWMHSRGVLGRIMVWKGNAKEWLRGGKGLGGEGEAFENAPGEKLDKFNAQERDGLNFLKS